MEVVAVDIGGTHARFAIAEVEGGRVVSISEPITQKTADHASLQLAWEAYGAELRYESEKAGLGAQSILKGSAEKPMNAVKDGHEIEASELQLIGADSKGNGQRAYAKGPGRINIFDKANPNNCCSNLASRPP